MLLLVHSGPAVPAPPPSTTWCMNGRLVSPDGKPPSCIPTAVGSPRTNCLRSDRRWGIRCAKQSDTSKLTRRGDQLPLEIRNSSSLSGVEGRRSAWRLIHGRPVLSDRRISVVALVIALAVTGAGAWWLTSRHQSNPDCATVRAMISYNKAQGQLFLPTRSMRQRVPAKHCGLPDLGRPYPGLHRINH